MLQTVAQLDDQQGYPHSYVGQGGMMQAQPISPFHSTVPPHIPVQAYFVYVSINAGLTDEQAIVNLVLIERLCNRATNAGVPIIINSLTIHR